MRDRRHRLRACRWSFFSMGLLAMSAAGPVGSQSLEIDVPEVVLTGVPFSVRAQPTPGSSLADGATYRLRIGDRQFASVSAEGGELIFDGLEVEAAGRFEVEVSGDGMVAQSASGRALLAWLSILPTLAAIAAALWFRSVIPALFLGVWLGAWLLSGTGPSDLLPSLFAVFQVYVLDAVVDSDRLSVMLFSFMIGGMIGIVRRGGGMEAVVARVVQFADTARRGQVATAALGTLVFFDDYANTLVVGTSMRPVADRLRISREKLAFLVDSTAAPVTCIALVSTWIGYEVGLLGEALGKLEGFPESAYLVFLNSIAYSFYPILMLGFVFLIAGSGRDFSTMLSAERRARGSGQQKTAASTISAGSAENSLLRAKRGRPRRLVNALLPIGVLVVAMGVGLWVTGEGDSLQQIVGSADSYKALLWASLAGALIAAALLWAQRILTLEEIVEAWSNGAKLMFFAMVVLVLAWALGDVAGLLHAADFLVSFVGESTPAGFIPPLVFLLAAATSFATGSSWGTMALLVPIVVPLSWAVTGGTDAQDLSILYSSVACVLTGSVWGDHCSPISDTTILSSMASGCSHVDHVSTQLPYALLVGLVAVALGTLPTAFGVPILVAYGASAAILVGVVLWRGERV